MSFKSLSNSGEIDATSSGKLYICTFRIPGAPYSGYRAAFFSSKLASRAGLLKTGSGWFVSAARTGTKHTPVTSMCTSMSVPCTRQWRCGVQTDMSLSITATLSCRLGAEIIKGFLRLSFLPRDNGAFYKWFHTGRSNSRQKCRPQQITRRLTGLVSPRAVRHRETRRDRQEIDRRVAAAAPRPDQLV
ncbi:hypothetical protein Bbelb_264430 [Branchiostoma belcheri]|nr:hypothetical protein Bbelb_264430 [Branchiostoma belcheri]